MKISAGILTWNPDSNGRLERLRDCVDSLLDADSVTVFDNGSTDEWDLGDGFQDIPLVRIPRIAGFPHAHTCGYGMNKIAASLDADIIIMSNDDIVWHDGAVETLVKLWREAPDELTIISGLVEPTFALPDTEPWNLPLGTLELAGETLLGRKSVPGGAWTFRGRDKPLIFPVSTFPGVDDVPACHKLTAAGRLVACVDLASHEGIGESTWGNASHQQLVVDPLENVRSTYGV